MHLDPTDLALCLGEDGGPAPAPGTPLSPPILQSSLFTYPSFQSLLDGLAAEHRHPVYTRGLNPTVAAAERALAGLERGEAARCFGSGMAAISAVLMGLLKAGDHVLFVNHVYGPTLQLAEQLRRFGVEHDVLLDVEPAAVERALRPNTRLLWMESPGTMLFRVLDVAALAGLARARGVLTCIDNSWATPLLQKPLTLGVDLVVHSASKYLGGHSDLMAGVVVGTEERMEEIFYSAYMLNGGVLAPFDAWLLLRGLRTLPVRLRQQEEDALRVAEFLSGHPAVERVYHPALSAERALAERQMRGYSGLFAFSLARGDFARVAGVIDRLRRFRIGVSWGGVESLVISPNRGTNAAQLAQQGIPPGLIRLSVGLEGADALIADLDAALAGAA